MEDLSMNLPMLVVCVLLCALCPCVQSEGLFGCGGFVKSDVDINYSLVEVKLYTPHGSIKYQTDCAPNTGYYLIPLYDKGDYKIKTHPPKGWGFEPESVDLQVDGETDQCSRQEDINFKFTGFSVYGKVISAGLPQGPAGVELKLRLAKSVDHQATTITLENGDFSFANVMPGDYKIIASHPTWQFSKSEVKVTVTSDNANLESPLIIDGYDVRGTVTGDGHPMKGVNFVLFSDTVKSVPKCQTGSPKDFRTKSTNSPALCHVRSGDQGEFVFPVVPSGTYHLVPFYKGEHITFDVEPDRLDFTVSHASLVLPTKFEVAGFSVMGKVLDKQGGSGIPKVQILINGKDTTFSAEDGSFSLENMKTGTYRLNAKVDNIAFEEMTVEITPKTPELPSIVAVGFSLCGKVVIDRVPESLGQVSPKRRVIYYPQGKRSDAKSTVTDAVGAYCVTVGSGSYVVTVPLTGEEVKAGLTLVPQEKTVEVMSRPVLDVNFSQFRAQVSGSVKCMEKCQPMALTLDAVARSDIQIRVDAKVSDKNEASFSFDNIMPGKYKASILMDAWCWKERTVEIEVLEKDLKGLEFVHTGYILKCSVSHPITMNFAHNKKEKNVGSFLLDRGMNRFCLAHPGVYQLTPESCHKFESPHYTHDTSNPSTLTLTAIQHKAVATITTTTPVNDITVTIASSVDDTPVVVGPLKPEANEDKKAKQTVYSLEHWARSGESLTLTAQSADLLFYPASVQVYISGDACPGTVAELIGKAGVFVQGTVNPPLEGVLVTVSVKDSQTEPIEVLTSANGQYKVGPLHADSKYEVSAKKEGYVMSEIKEKPMSFQAFKLGEISVEMQDESGQSLSGVLLSLSGEKQYRSNNVTGSSGQMFFLGLSPGQYFLRPMMKEYKFEPASQQIQVLEGTTKKIVIKGARVAFSCFGKVTSLNGEPEPGVFIEATGLDQTCQGFQEEGKTDIDGSYRLRGLLPKCTYEIRIKTGVTNAHIERTAPSKRLVMAEDKDLTEVDIIAFRRMNHADISGNFKTDLQFLSTLKVQLMSEAQPDSPIYTAVMSKSTFFYMPTQQMDGKRYILSVESSLARAEYDFTLPSVDFVANKSHRHFTFDFKPKLKSVEQDLNRGSYLILPMVALAVALAYNYKTVLPHAQSVYQQVLSASNKAPMSNQSSSSLSQAQASDTSIPREFLGPETSPLKKRNKPRKAQ